MTDNQIGTLPGLIADLETLHHTDEDQNYCYHCELNPGWDYASGDTKRDWPCPTMQIVQTHKRSMYIIKLLAGRVTNRQLHVIDRQINSATGTHLPKPHNTGDYTQNP